jgi:hypothetical protein
MRGIADAGRRHLAPAGAAPLAAGSRALPRGVFPRRLALRLIPLAACASVAAAFATLSSPTPARHAGAASRSSHASSLPLAASLAISRQLGSDLAEYRLARTPGGFLARNARQGLTASFGERGVTVIAHDGAHARIALQAIGFGSALHPAGLAQPLAHANRVEYRRGAASEWFANGPAGVEQGFTIAREPAGAADGLLTLALGVSGTLAARPEADGGVMLAGSNGKAMLRYNDLSVSDESGRSLPAHMTIAHGHVLISVDARGAHYPIRVDPLVQDAELTNSTEKGEGDFGFSVAIDGSTIVVGATEAQVGATEHQGAAFVFTEPDGGWSGALNQVAELTNNSGGAYTNFGWSVAISGATIVVGARNVGVYRGAVYEFTEPGGGWTGTLQPTATLEPGGSGEYDLGYSVAISGSTVVAGAPDAQTTGGGVKQGVAEVFTEPVGGWKGDVDATANFTSSASPTDDEEFGDAVAISGHTIVVGAPGAIIPGSPQQNSDSEVGAAYVFTEPGGGWVGSAAPAAALTDGATGDRLGFAVALGGEGTAFVDAPCAPKGCTETAEPGVDGAPGVVDIYSKPGGGWASTSTPTGALTDSGNPEPSDLGESLAADGSTVVAGAPLGGFIDVFDEPGGGWASETQTGQFPAPSGALDLGFAVGVSGETPVATAFFHVTKNGQPSGGAFIFGLPLPPPGVVTTAASGVGQTAATLDGSVNPHGQNVTECQFEWGTSKAYGQLAACSSAPGSGNGAVPVSAPLSGLSAGTTYYYRLIATSDAGTGEGLAETFATGTNSTGASPGSSGTTTTPTSTTSSVTTPTVSPVLECSTAQVALINVVQQGSHVLITGAARLVLAGKTVSIRLLATRKTVASATIGADGNFSASAPLPPAKIRGTNLARYEAIVGSLHSLNLKLERRMYMVSATRSGDHVVLSGYVTGSFKAGTAVKLLLRVTCSKEEVVTKVKLTRSGKFSATVPAPTGAERQIAVYRASTSVLDDGRSETTYTLPTPPTG